MLFKHDRILSAIRQTVSEQQQAPSAVASGRQGWSANAAGFCIYLRYGARKSAVPIETTA
ncbi:hypothetical protein J2125_003116 [Erwinia toletana]|uniref:Uncharacterized protein n=1 Tax=Winslowiella toletana TaxID=92490 RepID=A0ABS4PB99_9GAMM|nr:hypothetical protein [Winslowiella toletana]MBP2169924.1 hypothetical protein [Winslowiella toletana]